MKSSIFKFTCIFVIAMFCLAPLSAIDLNQDNIAQEKDNDTDFIIVNHTANASSDDGIKIINVTSDDSGNDAVLNIKGNTSQSQLSKNSPHLSARIADVTYGEAPVVEVYSEKNLYARIAMECPNFTYEYKVGIQNGYLRYQFREECDLKPGTYNVKLSTIGDENFDADEITTQFNVLRIDPKIKIEKIDNIVCGKKAVINVEASKKFNSTVDLKLNNSKTIPLKFVDGKASASIENLTPGNYNVNIDFIGDDYFAPNYAKANFTVFGSSNPNLSVAVDDIQYGEHPVLKVHSNESVNGTVRIKTDQSSMDYERKIQNGYLECEIPEEFKVGNHNVLVEYCGDNTFEPQELTTRFAVEKADTNLSIHVEDAYSADDLHVVVDADKRFNGNVTISLNNRVYFRQMEVVNGHAESYYPNGDLRGNYTAKASTEGNDIFKAGNCSTVYEVK